MKIQLEGQNIWDSYSKAGTIVTNEKQLMTFELQMLCDNKITEVILSACGNYLSYYKKKTSKKCQGILYYSFDVSIEWHNNLEFEDFQQFQYQKFTLRKQQFEITFVSPLQSLRPLYLFLKTKINQKNLREYYQVVQKIGRGGFAHVYEIVNRATKEHFAAKAFIRSAILEKQHGIDALINEITLTREMKHPNLINLIEVYESPNTFYLITPLYTGSSLSDVLQKTDLSEPQISNILYQLLLALKYLAEQGIIHRDLKLQNIMFKDRSQNEIVLIDLGLATKIEAKQQLFMKCGTAGFVAPEIVNSQDRNMKFHSQSDMFSLGCVAHFLLLNKPIFYAESFKKILALNKMCQIDFFHPQYSIISPQARNFLIRLLKVDPKQRLTAVEALKHNFIQQYIENENVGEESQEFNPLEFLMQSKQSLFTKTNIDFSMKKLGTSSEINTFQQIESSKMLIPSLKYLDILKNKQLTPTNTKQFSPKITQISQIIQQFIKKQQFARESLNSNESSDDYEQSKNSCSIDESDKNSQQNEFKRTVRRSSQFSQIKKGQSNCSVSPLSRYQEKKVLDFSEQKLSFVYQRSYSQEKQLLK